MPYGDGTGPFGAGPMTGRAAGFCGGFDVPGSMNPSFGRGLGGFGRRGWGRGFGGGGWGGGGGRHRWYYATGHPGRARFRMEPYWDPAPMWTRFDPPPPSFEEPVPRQSRELELEALKSRAEYFENMLEEIKKRIEVVEATQKKEQETGDS